MVYLKTYSKSMKTMNRLNGFDQDNNIKAIRNIIFDFHF